MTQSRHLKKTPNLKESTAPNKWFSAFLGLFFQPLAFLYLAKYRWASLYLIVLILVGLTDFVFNKTIAYSVLSLFLAIVCCAHAFIASKHVTFEHGRKWCNKWWGALLVPVMILSSVFLFRAFFYEPFLIPSKAMLPTLQLGNHVVVSKFGYGLYGTYGIDVYSTSVESRRRPKRGQVVVFYPPHSETTPFIKRIIGLPNDIIEFTDKQLYVNGSKIEVNETDKLDTYTETLDGNTYSVQYVRETSPHRNFKGVVPENTYFVMGDNRDNSSDSRVWGYVPAENIIGKLILAW